MTDVTGLNNLQAYIYLGTPVLSKWEFPISIDPQETPLIYSIVMPNPNRGIIGGLNQWNVPVGTPPGSAGVPKPVPQVPF